MRLVRTIFTLVVAASLAALPARVGPIGMFGGSGTVASSMADCAPMGDTSCQQDMSVAAGAMVSMSDGCDRSGDHGTMLPGACSTYCNSLPTLPTIAAVTVQIVLIAAVAPAVDRTLDGISVSPEPHPPKLV
ncbi:MAG TPA: hypothetical protein VNO18_15305 [Xanthobacteraceae bacterium]|jgi:hypothetical protein|nr:hypothetical protein [Xanthobacteraceae bacterium]